MPTPSVITVSLNPAIDRVIEVDHGEMRHYEGNYDYYLSKTHHQ